MASVRLPALPCTIRPACAASEPGEAAHQGSQVRVRDAYLRQLCSGKALQHGHPIALSKKQLVVMQPDRLQSSPAVVVVLRQSGDVRAADIDRSQGSRYSAWRLASDRSRLPATLNLLICDFSGIRDADNCALPFEPILLSDRSSPSSVSMPSSSCAPFALTWLFERSISFTLRDCAKALAPVSSIPEPNAVKLRSSGSFPLRSETIASLG